MLPLLRPGRYQMTISHPGFRTYQRSNIVLEVNQKANIDVRLEIGQTTERVEVTDQAAPISTEATDVGKVVDNTSIQRIPLNGRLNINGLLALAPGIQNAGPQDQVPITASIRMPAAHITTPASASPRWYGAFHPEYRARHDRISSARCHPGAQGDHFRSGCRVWKAQSDCRRHKGRHQ